MQRKLFFGGKVLTVAEPLYAEAVMVENDRIAAVGSEAALRAAYTDFEEVDLGGGTLLPGFIDCHSHFPSITTIHRVASVYYETTVDGIRKNLQNYIKTSGKRPGEWIFVRDYDETILDTGAHPTREEMDSLCPGYPVILHHRTGHCCVFNSLGMEVVGLTEDAPDIPNGIIGKDKNGRLTGYVSEAAFNHYRGKVHEIVRTDEEALADCEKAFAYYASAGFTTVQDGNCSLYWAKHYRHLASEGKMPLDLIAFAQERAFPAVRDHIAEEPHNCLKLGGIKVFLDGCTGLRTALVRDPYPDSDACGIQSMTDERLRELFILSAQNNVQILVHAIGDGAVDRFLDALESAAKEYPVLLTLRPIVLHCILMREDQMARAKALGVTVSVLIHKIYLHGDFERENLGEERMAYFTPAKTVLEAGVPLTFHADCPVYRPNVPEALACAVTRETRKGSKLSGQEITVLDAIKAFTATAAYQYFEEDIKGTIEVGKYADFALLDGDPLTVPKENLRDLRVLATYKNGECVYKQA